MLTLAALETIVVALGRQLQAPPGLLPTFGRNEDFARPEVRVSRAGYHWVIVERGREEENRVFSQLEELLYQVFSTVAFTMAGDYELRHRVPGQDTRLLLFARQVELLDQLDPTWAARRRTLNDWYLSDRSQPRPEPD